MHIVFEPEEVAQRRFLVTSRGYDRDEVRAFLSELAEAVATLQREQEALQRELARARATAAAHGATPPADPGTEEIAAKTAAVLAAAHEAAGEIERQARLQAERELRAARHRAATTVAEAERRRDSAKEETDRLEARQAYLERDLRVMERSASRLAERLDAARNPQPEASDAARDPQPEASDAARDPQPEASDAARDRSPAASTEGRADIDHGQADPATGPRPPREADPASLTLASVPIRREFGGPGAQAIDGPEAERAAEATADDEQPADEEGRADEQEAADADITESVIEFDEALANRALAAIPDLPSDEEAEGDAGGEASVRDRQRATMARPMSLFSLIGVFVVGSIAAAALLGLARPDADLEVSGPDDGMVLGAPDIADLAFTATSASDSLSGARLSLDGRDVTAAATVSADRLRYEPAELADGAHTLRLEPDDETGPGASHTWRFVVDTTPPELTITSPEGAVAASEPIVVAGTAPGAHRVEVDGRAAELDGERFSHTTATTPPADIAVVATDDLGNTTETTLEVAAAGAAPEVVRGVQMSMWAWASPVTRQPVLDLAEQGLISAVSLDIKDESGAVGHASAVDLAQRSGAALGLYDLDEAVATLEEHDVRVIGRIVAFADPRLADWLWERGRHDAVVQTAEGAPRTSGFGGFTSFVDAEVRDYNLALAVEAAEAGVDDILWEAVHRPDGPLDDLVLDGLERTPEEAIAGFLDEAAAALEPTGVGHGASVYGVAADRPTEIGQDVPAMAEHVDYLAPIVYPSSWSEGEHGIADPSAEPAAIVRAALEVFADAVEGSDTRLVPWLQDFSLDQRYGAEAVRAQIEGAAEAGVEEFLLWNPGARYTRAALE